MRYRDILVVYHIFVLKIYINKYFQLKKKIISTQTNYLFELT